MKDIFCFCCACVSSAILYLVGDITMPFIILLIFMCTDYITGLILSGVFKNQRKQNQVVYHLKLDSKV